MGIDLLGPRLLAWGTTAAGLGIGLIVATFVGEYTPTLMLWGAVLLVAGAGMAVASRVVRSKRDD
ncbi:MAG: hypothetical protein OYI31_02350 [Chloroflexota bacterium]|nr:hypothetical protein [Chloroflexota bacterium]MDE2942063.1 hypothetical protein [Chloroflexota bacterium]MDE3267287.1 hypothetical protein [Chloroflexota bacterium]